MPLSLPLILVLMSLLQYNFTKQSTATSASFKHSFIQSQYITFCYYFGIILFLFAGMPLWQIEVVHQSTCFMSFAYLNDYFLKDYWGKCSFHIAICNNDRQEFPTFPLSILLYLQCAFCQQLFMCRFCKFLDQFTWILL